MDFKQIKNSFKPLHMWSWNDKLNTEYTNEHTEAIKDFGFGSVCIHAQSGLQTRYMGDEWFRNIGTAFSMAEKSDIEVWVCDENGYPSGSGNGAVNSAGIEFQQKFLCCEAGEKTNDRTIICKDGYHFYYDINPYYIDVLSDEIAQHFINEAYVPYTEKFNGQFKGFFSYMPQLSYKNIPWSFSLPAAYKNAYGEELLDVLTELFHPVGDYKATRVKFWRLVSDMFSENFLSPIFTWCNSNSVKFSSLLGGNNTYDFTLHGSVMPQYKYMHMPCIKVDSRFENNALSSLMASSAAHQFGKQDSCAIILSKAGNSATFDDLKRNSLLQLARGISKISPAYESYSLNGIRKRSNPTHTVLRSELHNEFIKFNDYISRLEMIISRGTVNFDTLLIHNQTSMWECYDNGENSGTEEFSSLLLNSVNILEKKHIPFHLGDEIILQKNAYVDGDCLCIGTQRYKTIVLPENSTLLESTTKLLSEFERGGGFIAVADSLCRNDVCDNENLIYTVRKFNDCTVHFFFNNSEDSFTSAINCGTKMLDIETGDILPFYGVYKFSPYECIVVINDDTPELPRPFKKPLKTLDLSGEWNLDSNTLNSLILDKCDVYIDGELKYENTNASDVTEIIACIRESADIECRFNLNVTKLPENIYLSVTEQKGLSVCVNKIPIELNICGCFINEHFPLIDISSHLTEGSNEISLLFAASPNEELLNAYTRAFDSESELNRIAYDIEVEPLYIIGDFSVNTDGDFRRLDRGAYRYIGDFSIDDKRTVYDISKLEQQGFISFAGQVAFSKTFNLSDTQYCIKLCPKGVTSIVLEINGKKATPLIWNPYELDISEMLKKGDNEIKITLTTNLRNLLGPHHIPIGEIYTVETKDFYKKEGIWNRNTETPWESNYCFIEFGIESLE